MTRLLSLAVLSSAVLIPLASLAQSPIRVGMIGLDTSHCPAFTKLLNDPNNSGAMAGVKVVAAYPGGSPDVADSRDRIEKFTQEVREMGVEIVPSIDALLKKVDAVLVESVDARPHLAQARQVIAAGKPLFIDKPMSGSLADAIEIFRLASTAKVPCFSSSSMRFAPDIQSAKSDPKTGDVAGCIVYSPCILEEHHPDLFWYGIHGVEMMYTIMGPGCKQVVRTQTPGTEVATGVWKDGRVATYRGLRDGKRAYGAVVFGSKGVSTIDRTGDYKPLIEEVCKFFRTGKPPVSAEETIELLAFMEAADESKRQGGAPVTIESVIAKAKKR